jgi:prevent-host-death family protein
MVQAYSIYETKAKFSEILRIVKSGKEVIVNERGHSIARILPFKQPNNLKDRLEWLSTTGQIIQAETLERDFTSPPRSTGALKRFLEERE